ncbi:MAG TPA: hypothetical protein ENH32_08295 [Proteobacteria bacterium]|nr:hypothetical protein [Pseudomonadota bacterium]
MIFDYYASLTEQKACPKKVNECGLASGFADGCLVWSCQDKPRDKKTSDPKNEARKCYMKRASDLEDLKLPPDLNLDPGFSQLPDSSWFGIEVGFELLSPWYSRDDRPYHVLDNPVRKDRVFGVPFMSAASWKGLLRWACRMEAGLFDYLKKPGMKLDGWKDPSWIVHLFGNEKSEQKDFRSGALVFHPTWFDKIGFEVINPHKRKTRAGTQPIYYEVVPAGTTGSLRLLYAPLPGKTGNDKIKPVEVIANLVDAITALLETYGISAKRTAGWGAVEVKSCSLFHVKGCWFGQDAGSDEDQEYDPPEDEFKTLLDENGCPIKILLDENGKLLSKTQFKKLGDKKPYCTNTEFESFKDWHEKCGEEYKKRLNGAGDSERLRGTVKRSFDSLAELKTMLENARKGGGR